MCPARNASDSQRRSGTSRRIRARNERLDQRGLVTMRVLDAQQPRARTQFGGQWGGTHEPARADADKEKDATSAQPPARRGSRGELP